MRRSVLVWTMRVPEKCCPVSFVPTSIRSNLVQSAKVLMKTWILIEDWFELKSWQLIVTV